MWNSKDILDLQNPESARKLTGYSLNIRSNLMTDDLKPFVVTPRSPARCWHDDLPRVVNIVAANGKLDFERMSAATSHYDMVCLSFPDVDHAKASSIGKFWAD